jgi:2-C-methyl-D-erythritol 4-phosphate cytidylyltransferase
MGGKKQFMRLCGRPLFLWALETLIGYPPMDGVILVVPPDDVDMVGGLTDDIRDIKIVSGGGTRQESVWLGLRCLPADTDWVVVHDAARPLLKPKDLVAVCSAAALYGAATLGVPVKETVKVAGIDDLVRETLSRECLWSVQTPQVFRYDWLLSAHRRARREGIVVYDDATLLELDGKPVKLVSGSYDNIKVTTPEDLLVAGILMGGK